LVRVSNTHQRANSTWLYTTRYQKVTVFVVHLFVELKKQNYPHNWNKTDTKLKHFVLAETNCCFSQNKMLRVSCLANRSRSCRRRLGHRNSKCDDVYMTSS